MKIAHLFLVAVSLLLLASPGFASEPTNKKECKAANGSCKISKCAHPFVQNGKCGKIRKCCTREQKPETPPA